MTDLASWLLAQIADDEAAALTAYDEASDYRVVGSELAELHFVNWKPDRVLAECAAKRAIVELYQARLASSKVHKGDLALAGSVLTLLGVVKLLAQPYADREGFDPAWKVGT